MLAALLKCPELELDREEAEGGARAAQAIQSCYSFRMFSPEALAWIGAGVWAVSVYGPRWIAIRNRQRAEHARPAGPVAIIPSHADQDSQPAKQP